MVDYVSILPLRREITSNSKHRFQIIREQRFQMYDHLSSVRDSFRAGTSTKQTIPVQRINSGGFAGTGDTVLFDGTPNGETITQQLVMASGTSTMSPSKRDTVQHRLYRPRSLSASASSLRRAQGQAEAVRMNTASASYASHSVGHVPPRFPTTQLRPPNVNRLNVPSTGNSADTPCPPIAIFYGGSDTIPDMPDLLHAINFYTIEDIAAETRALVDGWCRTGLAGGIILHDAKKPDGSMTAATMDAIAHADGSPLVYLKCMPSYEHLSLLWGDLNAHEIVPDVARVLDGYRWETRKC